MVPHHRLTLSPSRLAWIAWGVVGVVLACSLALPAATFPGEQPWVRRFQTPEIGSGSALGQTFVMTRDGLNAVEFHPASTGRSPSGRIRIALIDVTERSPSKVVRTGFVDAAALAGRSWYRFEFAPVADSRNHQYRFELSGTANKSGFALLAAKGEGYPDGTLTFNGYTRFGDLAFQAVAPTSSMLRTLWNGHTDSGASGKLVLVLLIASWIAMAGLFRALLSIPADLDTAARP